MGPRTYVLAAVLTLGTACGGVEEASEEASEAIQTDLAAYLPRLAETYRSGDPAVLEQYAAPKEIAVLRKRLADMRAESREIHPTFKSFTLEKTTVWNRANAFVTTLETWDLRVVVAGTDRVLSESLDQRDRVKYQLKLVRGRWQVFFRELETTFD